MHIGHCIQKLLTCKYQKYIIYAWIFLKRFLKYYDRECYALQGTFHQYYLRINRSIFNISKRDEIEHWSLKIMEGGPDCPDCVGINFTHCIHCHHLPYHHLLLLLPLPHLLDNLLCSWKVMLSVFKCLNVPSDVTQGQDGWKLAKFFFFSFCMFMAPCCMLRWPIIGQHLFHFAYSQSWLCKKFTYSKSCFK